jgi:type 2 lantibiotic biosynthesis protein LanM
LGLRNAAIEAIVRRATPLWERNLRARKILSPRQEKKAQARLMQWAALLGSEAALDRRLRATGFSREELATVLSGASDDESVLTPTWASILEVLAPRGSGCHEHAKDPFRDRAYSRTAPIPFQEILITLVQYARIALRQQAGGALEVLGPRAARAFERQLLSHLAFVASPCVGSAFFDFRFDRAPASAAEALWRRQAPSTVIYTLFVQHMQAGGFFALLVKYPVLARLLCQSVEQWVAGTATFCRRFSDDFALLQRRFKWEVADSRRAVSTVFPGLSDRHEGGQSVIEVLLKSRERVIYKPRSVAAEAAYLKWLSWINSKHFSLLLKAAHTVDRGSHGWMEFVPFGICRSLSEVKRFYSRAGMLLAMLHVTATNDIHCENLIANGEYPVVVDLETLLCQPLGTQNPATKKFEKQPPSVLDTGLLPHQRPRADAEQRDLSALGADGAQSDGIMASTWQLTNTDQMYLADAVTSSPPLNHRVHLGHSTPPIGEHLLSFLSGFEEIYGFFNAQKRLLRSSNRRWREFDGLDLRVLLRSTPTYVDLQLHLLRPQFLKDGLDRSIQLEWLARPLSGSMAAQPGRVYVYDQERLAMERLDIPRFMTGQKKVHGKDDPDLWTMFAGRDSRQIRKRLAQFGKKDLDRHVAAIKECIAARSVPPATRVANSRGG